MGMFYKANAYLAHYHMAQPDNAVLLKAAVVTLSVVEFMLGLYLLLGIRRRLTAIGVTVFMSLMTAVTVYVAVAHPVADCGCFGAALTLTDGQTLGKNIVLLAAALVVLKGRRYLPRLISERNQWITSLYALAYIVLLALYALHYLPPMDFTPYHRGADMRAAFYQPTAETPAALVSSYFETEEGDDATDRLLQYEGYTFLLTLPAPALADDGCNDRINDLYDDCLDAKHPFYAVVSDGASEEDIRLWKDRTGAAYPLLKTDVDQLKTMVRSNPGLLLLKDGVILGKWSNNDLPELRQALATPPVAPTYSAWRSPLLTLVLWFILPLLVIIIADGVWIGSKFYKHYTFRKHLKQTTKMRKHIVAGNWKMNKNLQDGLALAEELNTALLADKPNCDVIICTPFIHLASVAGIIDSSVLGLGAENCADKVSGAYTGEVSAEMVKSTGAQYVILGHSERRAYYHETPEILKEKVNLALQNGLKVIFCIGEVLEEREAGKQNDVVKAQLEGSLFDLTQDEFKNIILAYEPVWAIGTGKTATAEQAEEMHAFIRSTIADKFGAAAAEDVSILYGGSCKPGNAKEIFAKPNVDGGLIGGAALKAADFKGIIDAWK